MWVEHYTSLLRLLSQLTTHPLYIIFSRTAFNTAWRLHTVIQLQETSNLKCSRRLCLDASCSCLIVYRIRQGVKSFRTRTSIKLDKMEEQLARLESIQLVIDALPQFLSSAFVARISTAGKHYLCHSPYDTPLQFTDYHLFVPLIVTNGSFSFIMLFNPQFLTGSPNQTHR